MLWSSNDVTQEGDGVRLLNLTEDSFFDEPAAEPAGAVTAAIEMLRVGQTSWMSPRQPSGREACIAGDEINVLRRS